MGTRDRKVIELSPNNQINNATRKQKTRKSNNNISSNNRLSQIRTVTSLNKMTTKQRTQKYGLFCRNNIRDANTLWRHKRMQFLFLRMLYISAQCQFFCCLTLVYFCLLIKNIIISPVVFCFTFFEYKEILACSLVTAFGSNRPAADNVAFMNDMRYIAHTVHRWASNTGVWRTFRISMKYGSIAENQTVQQLKPQTPVYFTNAKKAFIKKTSFFFTKQCYLLKWVVSMWDFSTSLVDSSSFVFEDPGPFNKICVFNVYLGVLCFTRMRY